MKTTNYSKYSTLSNSNNNNSISLSNVYKSSLNNPIRVYSNKSSNYSMQQQNTNNQRNKPMNIKSTSNPIRINTEAYNRNYNSQRNRIVNSSNNNHKTQQSKGGTSHYRRRNENNSTNLIQKKATPDRSYNRGKNNVNSSDINRLSGRSFGISSNTSLSSSKLYKVTVQKIVSNRTNNRIREYSSKTNDLINRRIINTESQQYSERTNNSTIVNSTDLNNYGFYISRANYLDYNNYNGNLYNQMTQPSLPYKNMFIQQNPYPKLINTDYYSGNNYNDHSYYEINQYLNKNPHNVYEVNYGYTTTGNTIKYDRSSPLLKPYEDIKENINNAPSIPRRRNKINIPKNNELNSEQINKNKKKKKVMKYKIHQLKELRENEFKIQNQKKEKIKNKKSDGKVEEHVEKYFDKDGNCIGGKKVIIRQEYDNGQKIIKKLVEEKYKSNSGYESLKKQGEINYNNSHKKLAKKIKRKSPSKKGSNYNTLEDNQDEENNVNTIVTFGVNSKNSKLDDEIILENENDDKEADEQNIDINTEFDDEEKNDTLNKEPNLDKNEANDEGEREENEQENDKNNIDEENMVNDNLEEKSRENGGMNNDMEKNNYILENDENNNENQNEDYINKKIIVYKMKCNYAII